MTSDYSQTITLGYGAGTQTLSVPAENLIGIYHPKDYNQQADEHTILTEALQNPIGSPRLSQFVRPGQKVAFITSDLTRPCPTHKLLPPVIAELDAAGIPDHDITIILALGLHRKMSEQEIHRAIPHSYRQRFKVLNHDIEDVIRVGVTSRGTPVEIFRPVVHADVRVCLGVLEFHYFAGYSGGAKAIFPGCASPTSVTANHAMMTNPKAIPGEWRGNPVRADLEEAASMLGTTFILNVLVNERHTVAGAVAGDMIQAHRIGCDMVAERGKVDVPQKADIVIASAGGFPKDINLYQAQKALDNASQFARQGGIIILVAECKEGFGSQIFETWFLDAKSPQAILDKIKREFVLGGHKAAAFANVQLRQKVMLVSSMPREIIHRTGLIPYRQASQALADALETMGKDAKIIVLPMAGSILPRFSEHMPVGV